MSPSRIRLLSLACALLFSFASAAQAALPTAEEILRINEANRRPFAHLHLRSLYTLEATDADARKWNKQDEEKEQLTKQILAMKREDLKIEFDGRTLVGDEAIAFLQQAEVIDGPRKSRTMPAGQAKAFQHFTLLELFRNGGAYQFRSPRSQIKTQEAAGAWTFSEAPLTTESLRSTYAGYEIFSRTPETTPASRWWTHGSDGHAYIMNKHFRQVHHVELPPYVDFMSRDPWELHPFDAFFSQPAEKYRVVRQEELDGRTVTVVDVMVPLGEGANTKLGYRAWLDLARGAIPLKLAHTQFVLEAPVDSFDRAEPSQVTTTREVRELAGGVFYPVKTVREDFGRDPAAPEPKSADDPRPPLVVHRRHTWECSTVEFRSDWPAGFFVLPFAADQKLFDHDAGKMLGALEPQPLVKVGQEAPPLTIARWLDGKPRTLADLKGQVVVLDFWGLWCGACRESVPHLNELRKPFEGKPVTFVSIHNAEKDIDDLAERIEEFRKKTGWEYLAAIDSGTMIEDSATTTAYGVMGFPLTVIIGPDGKIAYADPQDASMTCDEMNPILLAEFEEKMNALMKLRFQVAGEVWPIPDTVDEEEQMRIHRRVETRFLIHQINKALSGAPGQ